MPVLMLLMLLIYHISTQIELSQTKCNPTPLCLWIDKNVFKFFVCTSFILIVPGVPTNFCLTLYCCWSKWEFMQLQQGHGPNCHRLSAWYFAGHIGIAVPDVYAACKLFEEQGVPFVKKPNDGKTYSALYNEGHFIVNEHLMIFNYKVSSH